MPLPIDAVGDAVTPLDSLAIEAVGWRVKIDVNVAIDERVILSEGVIVAYWGVGDGKVEADSMSD